MVEFYGGMKVSGDTLYREDILYRPSNHGEVLWGMKVSGADFIWQLTIVGPTLGVISEGGSFLAVLWYIFSLAFHACCE